MFNASALNSLILNIYEAGIDPELWQQVALDISDQMNSGATQLLVLNGITKTENIAASSRLSQSGQREYIENYAPVDLRIPVLMKSRIGIPILEHSILNEREKKQNTEVSQFLKGYELENLTGVNLSVGDNWIWFGTARKGKNKLYTKDELDFFKLLIPHIRKSLRLYLSLQSISSRANSLSDMWDLNGRATVLFEGSGRIGFCNKCATKLVTNGLFKTYQKQLVFSDPSINQRFQKALDRALSPTADFSSPVADAFLLSDETGNDYGARLVPYLGDFTEFANPSCIRALLFITPLQNAENYTVEEIDIFGDVFGLTPAEKRVVKAVADLLELTEFAQEVDLKPDTVRKQLKLAMEKIGVNSQKKLIRRLERFCFLQMR